MAETECCACEPGSLASAFLRSSGFSLAATLEKFSTTYGSSWYSCPDWMPSGVFSCPSKAFRIGCSYDRLQAISPDTGLVFISIGLRVVAVLFLSEGKAILLKLVHLVISCRAVVHDTCKLVNQSECCRCKFSRNNSILRCAREHSSDCRIYVPCFAFTAELVCCIRTREGVRKSKFLAD